MVPKGETPFSAWEPPLDVGLLLTCHHSLRGEGLPKITRKVLQRNRPPNDYKASGLLLSHLPVKQCPRSLKTPAGPTHTTVWDLSRRGLAMDFIQMPVSQGYKYLLVMLDTFTGWIEGFPTWTEKAEEVVKKTAP